MTAEVVVMNPLGVALAADSAVTLGTEVDRKVYPSAEKLFQLSNACPIGVLIYGNSNFVSVPWETIIKTYRAERRLACFGTVREYGEDFLTFLRTNRRLLPLTNQRQEILKLALAYFQETVDIVYENIRRVTKGGAKKLSEADIRNLVQRVVDTVAGIGSTQRERTHGGDDEGAFRSARREQRQPSSAHGGNPWRREPFLVRGIG